MDNEGMTIGAFEYAANSQVIGFSSGFEARMPVRLVVPDQPQPGYKTFLEYDYLGGKIGVTSVSVLRDNLGTEEVTSELLRGVRIAEHTRDNLERIVTRFGKQALPNDSEILTQASIGAKDPRTLALIETLYKFAELTHQRPAKFIQEKMQLPPATAGRWIKASKQKLNWG
ncbi:hypothetical protein [Corynebacterium dentalis]|uniref:hypothetical protein n=1 Tax=Corynebacterium dentalis TaxID=2014528 RepID=UPI000C07C283|nr:hypothetical protein [Corynebacterium dentalis]